MSVGTSTILPRRRLIGGAWTELRTAARRFATAAPYIALLAAPASADVLADWRAAAELGCVAAVRDGGPFAAPGFRALGPGVWGAGDDLRARVTARGARLRVCELSAGGARVAPHVPAALEAFLDWADARVATGEWRYGDASRERRVVPVAARIVSTRPNARGCGVEAVLLGDPYGGHVSLTVAETAPEGGGACARPDG